MIETEPTDRAGSAEPRGRVMVVDDDEALAAVLDGILREGGYEVEAVTDARRALDAFGRFRPDLVILDLLMPSVDGISLCLELRRESDVPVVFLSARGEPPDRVVGLRVGADDYIAKPFDNDELLARVGALLRRSRGERADGGGQRQIRFGRFVIDLASVQAIAGDRAVALTPTEFKLLRTLAAEPGRVHSRDDLLTTVWGYAPGSDTRLVDVHVGRLRKKLTDAGVSEVAIGTARGFGYRLEDRTA